MLLSVLIQRFLMVIITLIILLSPGNLLLPITMEEDGLELIPVLIQVLLFRQNNKEYKKSLIGYGQALFQYGIAVFTIIAKYAKPYRHTYKECTITETPSGITEIVALGFFRISRAFSSASGIECAGIMCISSTIWSGASET